MKKFYGSFLRYSAFTYPYPLFFENINMLREHPFNLKGGGGLWFFGGEKFLLANLIEKKNSVSEMGRKKYSVSTLCLKNCCFCRKIHNVATRIFWLRNPPPPPQPFKLNRCSISKLNWCSLRMGVKLHTKINLNIDRIKYTYYIFLIKWGQIDVLRTINI